MVLVFYLSLFPFVDISVDKDVSDTLSHCLQDCVVQGTDKLKK